MKVVIAIDSLKGSLSSMDAGHAIKEGILRATPATSSSNLWLMAEKAPPML